MSLYLTRLSMTLLGVIALTGGSYAIESKVAVKRSHAVPEDIFVESFRHVDLELETWIQDAQTCRCALDVETDVSEEHADDHSAPQDTESCINPSPAERMGMAIRLVSL